MIKHKIELVNEWVMVKKWCDSTGDTAVAIKSRRRSGIWVNGVHCKVVGTSLTGNGGRLWINVSAANQWIASEGKTQEK